MNQEFDLAIVGSGFAGSLMALVARRLGRSVAVIDKGRHPRFAIGESSTPLANLLLEELAARHDLPQLAALSNWGRWQSSYPHLGCGLKRGFSFFHHRNGRDFEPRADRKNELLVAASPSDAIADTHWYRPDFDQFLIEQAQQLGAVYFDQTALETPQFDERGALLCGERNGETVEVRARFVVDASGPRGYLQRALDLPELAWPHLERTQGLYAHFRGVARFDENFESAPQPPFPVDDAALHHVFEGGWIWILRFNNGLTSAGIAANENLARELNLSQGARAWQRFLARFPTIAAQFAAATATTPFFYAPQLSFRGGALVGENWALLPSSAAFVDPLLSTGFPLALLGIARLAEIFERDWQTPTMNESLRNYAARTERELAATELLIAALRANFGDFELFGALLMLYFAAASYAETVRRLGRAERVASFLLCDDARFGPALRDCCARALKRPLGAAKAEVMAQIRRTVEPFDIAGWNRDKANWYPVDAADLFEGAAKVGATREEIEDLLRRCGFEN